MRNVILITTLCIIYTIGLEAQIIEVDSLDKTATELIIPKCHKTSSSFEGKGFNNLRKITFYGIDYLPPVSFKGLPNLEEVILNGDNLIIGGAQFVDLPKLKKIVMNGNTFLLNGGTAVVRCPEFETFEINGFITYSEMSDPSDSPNFKNYSGDFDFLYTDNSEMLTATSIETIVSNTNFVTVFRNQLSKISDILNNADNDTEVAGRFMWIKPYTVELAAKLNVDTTMFVSAYNKAKQNPAFWTKLETLQHSPAYATDTTSINFTYQPATSSALTEVRQRFNLDSIAGNGDDISKIKNLTYWIHDIVRHDGSSYNPQGPKTLANLVDTCQLYNRGVNCRMMAIMLTEALLAEGIPARYLTCQPKDFDKDYDCHVICVAWSDSLNKWVWADPTFAAFVTDENGLMLHPGEVRERLITNQPLVINEDANWNHESQQTKEDYIDYYMAKNLYYITAITNNRQAPEGDTTQSTYVTLSPIDSNFTNAHIITSDFDKFWQTPK
jgi:hypothetical protein